MDDYGRTTRPRPEVWPSGTCSVPLCTLDAVVCRTVKGGCVVVATEHQHLCAQHASSVQSLDDFVTFGPCQVLIAAIESESDTAAGEDQDG